MNCSRTGENGVLTVVQDRGPRKPIPPPLQSAIVSLLRGEAPPGDFSSEMVAACLKRYECGGYLHKLWSRAKGAGTLPQVWAEALKSAHRKTLVDNLSILSHFRSVGAYLDEEKIEFIVLKGATYLGDLYDDELGSRPLTDIDLLIRPADAGRAARRLVEEGYKGMVGSHYPEERRCEMIHPGPSGCRFEFHWRLGLPRRMRIDQREIWRSTDRFTLEGSSVRRLRRDDALLYHVGHLADHYFGHSLKWIIDLREMLRRWPLEPGRLARRSAGWGVRTALYVSLRHLNKLFPEEVPAAFSNNFRIGAIRRRLLATVFSDEPAEMTGIEADSAGRFFVRPLLIDRFTDAFILTLRVALRPATTLVNKALQRDRPPWDVHSRD